MLLSIQSLLPAFHDSDIPECLQYSISGFCKQGSKVDSVFPYFSHVCWVCPPKGGQGFLMSPPCLESQDFQFDTTFLYLLLCSSAYSSCSFYLILLYFWPILLISFSLNFHFPKGRLFCVAIVCLFLSGLFVYLLKAYSPANRTGSPQGFFSAVKR